MAGKTADDEDRAEEFEEACAIIAAPWDEPECLYLKAQNMGGATSKDEKKDD